MKKKWVYTFVFLFVITGIILVSSINLDLNHDGVINITDLQILAAHFEGKATYNSTFDLNGDNKINLLDITTLARQVNTSSSGGSVNLSGEPIPPPVGSSNVILDTRAGAARSIQGANVTTFSEALASMNAGYVNTTASGGTIYPLDFTPNFDGNGTHAFRFNWRYLGGYTGNASSCYNGNGEENKYICPHGIISSQPIYIQWKVWRGRTVTGGGDGNSTVGSFIDNGKLAIIYRAGTNDFRTYFGYNHASGGFSGDIAGNPEWNQNGPMVGTLPAGYLNYNRLNINDYNNQVVTFTLYLQPESSVGAGDGEYKAWIDNTTLWDFYNLSTGTLDYGAMQFGGPTWICPPQDQTEYMWDWVVWNPS